LPAVFREHCTERVFSARSSVDHVFQSRVDLCSHPARGLQRLEPIHGTGRRRFGLSIASIRTATEDPKRR
jgi:hypothetical protein